MDQLFILLRRLSVPLAVVSLSATSARVVDQAFAEAWNDGNLTSNPLTTRNLSRSSSKPRSTRPSSAKTNRSPLNVANADLQITLVDNSSQQKPRTSEDHIRKDAGPIYIIVTLLFGLVAAMPLVWTRHHWLSDMSDAPAKRLHLKETINSIAKCMEATCRSLNESHAKIAETMLDGKVKDFQKDLGTLEFTNDVFKERRLLESFRLFLELWQEGFRERSIDPECRPFEIFRSSELKSCTSVADMASFVSQQLEDSVCSTIAGLISEVQLYCENADRRREYRRHADHALSKRGRAAMYFLGISGLAVIAFDVSHNASFAAFFSAIALTGSICTICVCDIGNIVEELEEEKDRATMYSEQLKNLYGKATVLANLWVYRTIPFLDVLSEAFEGFLEVTLNGKPADALKYLQASQQNLMRVSRGRGPLSIWYGDQAFSEDLLMTIASQYVSTQNIETAMPSPRKPVTMENWQVWSFLDVRIMEAHLLCLPGQAEMAFVELKIDGAVEATTQSVCFGAAARWDWAEDFFLPLRSLDSVFVIELHVGLKLVGSLGLNLRDLRKSVWQTRKEKFRNSNMPAELSYELYFAENASELLQFGQRDMFEQKFESGWISPRDSPRKAPSKEAPSMFPRNSPRDSPRKVPSNDAMFSR